MSQDPAQAVLARNYFYEKNYRLLLRINVILLVIAVLLIGFIVYQNMQIRAPIYFPSTPDGRVITSPPININHLLLSKQTINPTNGNIVGMPDALTYNELKPLGEQALVKHWFYLAIEQIFNYDYIHYRTSLQSAREYFTAKGFERFMAAFTASRNLSAVQLRKDVVYPQIQKSDVKILAKKMIQGHYAWEVELSFKAIYENVKTDPITQILRARALIVRVSTLENPFYGLAISQINLLQID